MEYGLVKFAGNAREYETCKVNLLHKQQVFDNTFLPL